VTSTGRALVGANEIRAGSVALLLVASGAGTAVHLVAEHKPPAEGHPAVPDHYLSRRTWMTQEARLAYDLAALTEVRWSTKTLCGRDWRRMVGGDGGPLCEFDKPAYAPSCQRCTALMDRLFPAPVRDDRLVLVARLAVDLLVEHGFASVHNVPGDQQTALRVEIRRQVTAQINEGSTTSVHRDVVSAQCEAVYARHALDYSRAAVEAVSQYITSGGEDRPPINMPDWDTWAV
jgi:hypothetical protein